MYGIKIFSHAPTLHVVSGHQQQQLVASSSELASSSSSSPRMHAGVNQLYLLLGRMPG
jgi:hypothetical protein